MSVPEKSAAMEERSNVGDPNPDSGGRTALRGLVRSLAASSVSWLAAPAFSRGQYMRVGLTCVGIRLTNTTALITSGSRRERLERILIPDTALEPWARTERPQVPRRLIAGPETGAADMRAAVA